MRPTTFFIFRIKKKKTPPERGSAESRTESLFL